MELRQFAYLDALAVKSLLASQDIAVPEGLTEVNESMTEGGGQAGVSGGINIPYVGKGEGNIDLSGSKTGRQVLETSKRINDQFVFNKLYEELEDEIVDLNGDNVSLSEGDLVKLEGAANTDAIYRILTLFHTYSEIMDTENEEQIEQAYDLLYGDSVGISIEVNESQFSYGLRVNPDDLWVDQSEAFLGTKNYIVLGRVFDTFGGNESWDYLNTAELIASVLSDDTMDELRDLASQIIQALGQAEQDVELPDVASASVDAFDDLENLSETTRQSSIALDIEDREIALDGPGYVIAPIAIYW